jgi:hypothetical protein
MSSLKTLPLLMLVLAFAGCGAPYVNDEAKTASAVARRSVEPELQAQVQWDMESQTRRGNTLYETGTVRSGCTTTTILIPQTITTGKTPITILTPIPNTTCTTTHTYNLHYTLQGKTLTHHFKEKN